MLPKGLSLHVEEAEEEVESDMKKWLRDDRPDLHETRAVVFILRLKDDLEEKKDKERAKDDGDSNGRSEGEAENPLEPWLEKIQK